MILPSASFPPSISCDPSCACFLRPVEVGQECPRKYVYGVWSDRPLKSSQYLHIFSIWDCLNPASNSWLSLLCVVFNPPSIKGKFFFLYYYKHKENSIKSWKSSCSARTLQVSMVLLQHEHLSLKKMSSCLTKSLVQSEWRKHLFRKVYGLTSVWMSNIWARMGRMHILVQPSQCILIARHVF